VRLHLDHFGKFVLEPRSSAIPKNIPDFAGPFRGAEKTASFAAPQLFCAHIWANASKGAFGFGLEVLSDVLLHAFALLTGSSHHRLTSKSTWICGKNRMDFG